MTRLMAAELRLEQIVETIRGVVSPELVLLFGSRTEGRARHDSDYDLMVVLRDGNDLERGQRQIREALNAVGIPADVIVRSVSDYQRRQSDPGFLEWLIARHGLLLYSSNALPQRSAGVDVVRERPAEGIRTWIARGASDFRTAELSMASADPPLDAICFHAHACVEKLLKALIVSGGAYPPRTHVLPQLLARQAAHMRDDGPIAAACDFLQTLYPGSRYPDQPMPTLEQARTALESARVVRDRVVPLLETQ